MAMTVYWTRFAENKLEEIFDYYSVKASVRTARKLVTTIIDASLELEENPLIGQKEELLADRPQEFRYLICKKYKLIYWIDEARQRVEVANVFDCRQNPVKMKEF